MRGVHVVGIVLSIRDEPLFEIISIHLFIRARGALSFYYLY